MASKPVKAANDLERKDATKLVDELLTKELVFAVVGPVGAGSSKIAETLRDFLDDTDYDVHVVKARRFINEFANSESIEIPEEKSLSQTENLQDVGDIMRKKLGHSAIAERFAVEIRKIRAKAVGGDASLDGAIQPNKTPRAYILDSIRHPSEVALLRKIYQQSFCLIGVVCEDSVRLERLHDKYGDGGKDVIRAFMRRDEKAVEKHGQQVSSAFHLSDFFVENTEPQYKSGAGGVQKSNPAWTVNEELARLVDIIAYKKIVRPRPNETAMYHAHGARMRSSCLSRQVGAALLDQKGNILATGTNEVPRAGGGVYGGAFEGFSDDDPPLGQDHRCFKHNQFCSNTKEQNKIIDDLLMSIEEFSELASPDLQRRIRNTKIGQLIEFSRAVHAEMDALLSAAREGVSTIGSRLYVTTYPCHNCARHIVTAGVDEVQFIEPYLKSKALPLHGDSITDSVENWVPPSAFNSLTEDERKDRYPQVLFRPFKGVAPRLYRRAFLKDRDLKDSDTGDMLMSPPKPDGDSVSHVLEASYTEIEAKLAAQNPSTK